MRRATLALLAALTVAVPAAAQVEEPSSDISTRRVMITGTFSGERIYLFGHAPAGTTTVVAVLQGPEETGVRLMEKGRVALFWLGVRQYKLSGVPGLYLVNVSCPSGNGLGPCKDLPEVDKLNARLASSGFLVGLPAIRDKAHLEVLSGQLREGESTKVVDGFWELQGMAGLYGIFFNAIRLNPERMFYHSFTIPTKAPEGRYSVVTYFLDADHVLGVEEDHLFVRKAGFVAWLSRLAQRQALAYGLFAIGIAVFAGWLAGTIFKKGGHH
jgi:hypothetical protein